MFKVTGYLTDGVPKPTRRRVLYRGCTPVGRRGMSWTNERFVAERFTDYWVEHGYGATNPGHVYEAVVGPNYVLGTIRSTLETLNFNGTDHEIPAHSEWEFIVDARALSITLVETARERIARVEREEARLHAVRNAQGTPQGRLNCPTMSKRSSSGRVVTMRRAGLNTAEVKPPPSPGASTPAAGQNASTSYARLTRSRWWSGNGPRGGEILRREVGWSSRGE